MQRMQRHSSLTPGHPGRMTAPQRAGPCCHAAAGMARTQQAGGALEGPRLHGADPEAHSDGGAAHCARGGRQRRSKQLHDDRCARGAGTCRFDRAYRTSDFDQAGRPPGLAGVARRGAHASPTERDSHLAAQSAAQVGAAAGADSTSRRPMMATKPAGAIGVGAAQTDPSAAVNAPRRIVNKGARTTAWEVSRQPDRGRKVVCWRCLDFAMDGGHSCKPAGQGVARLWVRPECLPGDIADLTLRLGDGLEQKDLGIILANLQTPPTTAPAVLEVVVCLPVTPAETGAMGGTEEASGWGLVATPAIFPRRCYTRGYCAGSAPVGRGMPRSQSCADGRSDCG